MSSEALESVSNLEEIDEALKSVCKERQDYRVYTRWVQVKKACQELPELKAQVEELKQLREPPFMHAIYLGTTPGDGRELIVGVGSSRLEVHAAPGIAGQVKELMPGQVVVLNEKQNVIAIRHEHEGGETAEVVNIIAPEGEARVLKVVRAEPGESTLVEVQWRDEEVITLPCSAELLRQGTQPGDAVQVVQAEQHRYATLPARPRLHVKSGGTEGVVVEITQQLLEQDVKIGDIVRIDPGLKMAFERLPSYETGGLTLEEVPDITYDDIGGLDEQIGQIYDALELPYLYREEFRQYQLERPKGILLYGPPGCGKTMVAKAVAQSLTQNIRRHMTTLERHLVFSHDLQLDPANPELVGRYRRLFPSGQGLAADGLSLDVQAVREELRQFLRLHDISEADTAEKLAELRSVLSRKDGVRSFFLNVKGPELLDKYVGETEHRIRKIFEEARRHATSYYTPVVIFFDEMEAMFRTRGSGRSSDVETTIVPQFLSELDGVESTANLIIIGASNRQDMIDPAILRPKRLDVKIKVDRPTREAAQDIFSLYLAPTLPLCASGLDVPRRSDHLGAVVFRSAYARDSQQPGSLHPASRFLPPGCDFRLACSLQASDREALAQLPATLTLREVLALAQEESEQTRQLPWARLHRFRAGLTLEELLTCLRQLPGVHELTHAISQEWLAEALILAVVDLLYSTLSTMNVLTGQGKRYTFSLRDFMSGAVIANIVDRAKRKALKRLVASAGSQRSAHGIGLHDLQEAVRQEFEENKEQLALQKISADTGRSDDVQFVEIVLHTGQADPWSEERLRLYTTTFTLVR